MKEDLLEINNLSILTEYKPKVDEMMALLKEWYTLSNDTAAWIPKTFLTLEYDYTKLNRYPIIHNQNMF